MPKKVYVRVIGKNQVERFYRCGHAFTRAWSVVEVDDATLNRLNEEQMLEVSVDQPEDFLTAEVAADLVEDAETLLAQGDKVLVDGDNVTQLSGEASGESTAGDDEIAAQTDKSAETPAPATAKVTPIAKAQAKAKSKAVK